MHLCTTFILTKTTLTDKIASKRKPVGLHRRKMASADWMCNGHQATSQTTKVEVSPGGWRLKIQDVLQVNCITQIPFLKLGNNLTTRVIQGSVPLNGLRVLVHGEAMAAAIRAYCSGASEKRYTLKLTALSKD